jgi:hypothetical protein
MMVEATEAKLLLINACCAACQAFNDALENYEWPEAEKVVLERNCAIHVKIKKHGAFELQTPKEEMCDNYTPYYEK